MNIDRVDVRIGVETLDPDVHIDLTVVVAVWDRQAVEHHAPQHRLIGARLGLDYRLPMKPALGQEPLIVDRQLKVPPRSTRPSVWSSGSTRNRSIPFVRKSTI
jgi:hypothetical protein